MECEIHKLETNPAKRKDRSGFCCIRRLVGQMNDVNSDRDQRRIRQILFGDEIANNDYLMHSI